MALSLSKKHCKLVSPWKLTLHLSQYGAHCVCVSNRRTSKVGDSAIFWTPGHTSIFGGKIGIYTSFNSGLSEWSYWRLQRASLLAPIYWNGKPKKWQGGLPRKGGGYRRQVGAWWAQQLANKHGWTNAVKQTQCARACSRGCLATVWFPT